jgi:NADPH-dependent 2,4-dienoyl-CoA reductase/sulfur reductase-like enzyme
LPDRRTPTPYCSDVTERVVVIGGDAAGGSAASQVKRAGGDDVDVVMVERGRWTSYSACGIPYWIAGDVDRPEDLVARSPEDHRTNGIEVRVGSEAVKIDLDRSLVEVRGPDDKSSELGFDQLMIATGATPVRPDLPGIDSWGIFGVQTLSDGASIMRALSAERPLVNAVVVGGGYIGIEMAEAMLRRGLKVTVLDRALEPMSTLDPDMGRLVHRAMTGMGIDVQRGSVDGFEADHTGRVRAVLSDGTEHEADIVILGLGVRPDTSLADSAGLTLGESGGIRTDSRMQVEGQPAVFAAGDCVESFDRVSKSWVHVALGTHANKQGRVAGINLAGGQATFPGIVRTAVSKVCDLEIARTGLREIDARRAGLSFEVATIGSTTRAGYYPGATLMTVKMLAEVASGRLLGAQIIGREGAAKRVDVCAMALWTEMTVHELMQTDLSYAPPFSPVWDPVQVAARVLSGKLRQVSREEVP